MDNKKITPEKKLFAVKLGSISKDNDGFWVEVLNDSNEKVIAVDALEAIKKIKLSSTKDYFQFFCGVELISEIDKF